MDLRVRAQKEKKGPWEQRIPVAGLHRTPESKITVMVKLQT